MVNRGWWTEFEGEGEDENGFVAYYHFKFPCSYPTQSARISDIGVEMPTGQEVRIVDPVTGGEKGSKLARFDLIPPEAMWAFAEVYGNGAKKYADRNWEKGYAWGLSVAALERHLNLWKRGESIDQETGCYHLMQVVWHAVALFIFELRGLGNDDVRVKNG